MTVDETDSKRYEYCVYPKKQICTACSKPFETIVEGQTECNSCMIKPSPCSIELRREKRDRMARIFKERPCGCGKAFVPTGPTQKRCPDCMAAGKQYTVPKTESSESLLVPTEEMKPKLATAIREMIRAVMDQTGASSMTITITR
jgi:hypothetical protein